MWAYMHNFFHVEKHTHMWHPRRKEVGMHDLAPSLFVQKVFFTELNIHDSDSIQWFFSRKEKYFENTVWHF